MVKRTRTIRNARKRIVLGTCYPDSVEVIGRTRKVGPQDVLLSAFHEHVHPSWMRKYRVVLERIDLFCLAWIEGELYLEIFGITLIGEKGPQ